MKKNFKYVTMITAALLIGFSSCSNDESVTGGGEYIPGQPASLDLELVDAGNGNAITYAPGDGKPTGATEGATTSEGNINAANQHVYIFDATGQLEYVGNGATALTGISLTSGAKKVYFIANVTAPAFATFVATVGNAAATEANFLAEDFTLPTPAIGDLTAANNYYISHVGRGQAINVAPGANALNLNIGRGVAKINIDMTQAVNPANGTLSDAQYVIANNPADMYFAANYSGNQLQTPFFNNPAGASAYFNNGVIAATGITSGQLPADGDKLNSSYATENAIATANVKYATINYAVIQATFAPGAVVDVANTASVYTAGDDFYRIQYVEEDAGGTVVAEHGYFAAFIDALPSTSDPVYTAAQAAAPTAAAGNVMKLNVVQYTGDGSTGAPCYYFLGLGDTRITTAGQETERYTVERNSYYYYEVASVADCGSNTPVPPATVTPPMTSTLNINLVTGPWGVVGGAGGLTPGI